MTPARTGLPDGQQTTLLQACLLEDRDAARAAFARWSRNCDLDTLDAASVRLLPLLVARADELAIPASSFGRYRGIQRQGWTRSQLLFSAARPAIAALHHAGIGCMALKGAVLCLTSYPSVSLRPMSDLDLLVPAAQASEAIATFAAAGWRPATAPPRKPIDFAMHNAITFTRSNGHKLEIDLHWRLFHWKSDSQAEEALWSRAEPLPALGEGACAPCPADLLLHVCAHGMQYNLLAPIRWVADAAMIVRRQAVDWDHFTAQCARFGLALPLGAALDYLADAMALDIPREVRERIARMQPGSIDRIAFALDQLPPDERPLLRYLQLHAHRAASMVGRDPLSLLGYAQRLRNGRSLGATARWFLRHARVRAGR